MKNLRKLCAAVLLTLVFSFSALADGQAHTTITDPPPPSADGNVHTGVSDGNMTTGIAGQIPTPGAGQMETINSLASPVDPATQMALTLLQSVWSLF